jgi:hypothetical protein
MHLLEKINATSDCPNNHHIFVHKIGESIPLKLTQVLMFVCVMYAWCNGIEVLPQKCNPSLSAQVIDIIIEMDVEN